MPQSNERRRNRDTSAFSLMGYRSILAGFSIRARLHLSRHTL
jgi:hypothetical protein